MTRYNALKWILQLGTIVFTLYVSLFVFTDPSWRAAIPWWSVLIVIAGSVWVSIVPMFFRPLRRWYYSFAPLFYVVGVGITITGLVIERGWLIDVGMLLYIPAAIYMYVMFRFPPLKQ